MNILFLIAALSFAALSALAVWKNLPRLEYIAKPSVMIALFLWLWKSAGLNGALFWFGLGILFSLAGDVLLMIAPQRLFLAGLAAFVFAHTAYVIGFNTPLSEITVRGIFLAVTIGSGGVGILRRIIAPLAAQGQVRLRIPIIVYGAIISIMLLSALIKLTDVNWSASAAWLVGAGAFLFYISDIILAWNKFVAPIRSGRTYNMIAYHLGQIVLTAGVIVQSRN